MPRWEDGGGPLVIRKWRAARPHRQRGMLRSTVRSRRRPATGAACCPPSLVSVALCLPALFGWRLSGFSCVQLHRLPFLAEFPLSLAARFPPSAPSSIDRINSVPHPLGSINRIPAHLIPCAREPARRSPDARHLFSLCLPCIWLAACVVSL